MPVAPVEQSISSDLLPQVFSGAYQNWRVALALSSQLDDKASHSRCGLIERNPSLATVESLRSCGAR